MNVFKGLGRLVALGGMLLTLQALGPMSAYASNTSACPSNAAITPSGTAAPAIVLSSTENSKSLGWSFGGGRDSHSWPITVKGEPNLKGLNPADVEVEPGPLTRDDNHATINAPTYTAPKISPSGKYITLTLCASARGAKPGKYTGNVRVDGPPSIAGTTIPMSVTAKEGRRGLLTLVGLSILVVAGFALSLKGVTDYRRDIDGKKDKDGNPVKFNLPDALTYVWTGDRLIASVLGIVAGLVTGYLLYTNSDTWGEHLGTEWLAMARAVIAAVGAQALIDSASSSLKKAKAAA